MVDGRDRSSSTRTAQADSGIDHTASQTAKAVGARSKRRSKATLLAGPLVTMMCVPALAGPQGERVVHGDASFHRHGNETTIRAADNTIINYRSFDIASDETVRFVQPDSMSRVLNRVNSSDPSQIAGRLIANGQVYIVNRAGVYFHEGATVNVGSLYAAAGNISNRAFLNERNRFSLTGEVVNHGAIEGEFVGLFGQRVENFGSIVSPEGTVAMVAGDEVIVGERGGRIFAKAKASSFAGSEAAAADGGVVNGGTIVATEGDILVGAGDVYALVLHDSSVLRGNRIDIAAGDLAQVSGIVDASSAEGVGGTIHVTGDRVAVTGAELDASGALGGGEILVGGDVQGTGDTRRASRTIVDGESILRADATVSGDGGKVVVWADDITGFTGFVSARGGEAGGDGGFAEVSGKQTLVFLGDADLAAPEGQVGELMLDPENITIVDGASGTGADDTNADFLDGIITAGEGPANSVISEGFLESFSFALTLIANDSITIEDLTDNVLDLQAATGTITFIANFNGNGGANPNGGEFRMLGADDTIRTGGANLFVGAHEIGVRSIDTRGVSGTGSGSLTLNANERLEILGGAAINTGGGSIILNANTDADATGLFDMAALSTIDSGGGNITVAGADWAVLGTSVDAGAGDVTFNLSTPGGANVSIGNSAQTINLDAAELGRISTSGTFTVGGAIPADQPQTLQIEDFDLGSTTTITGDVAFAADTVNFVNSASTFGGGLDVTAATAIAVDVDLAASATTSGQSLTLSAPTVTLGADLTNTGGLIDLGAVSLTDDATINAGSVVLAGVEGDGNGPWDLGVTATGDVTLSGVIGGTNALDTLDVSGAIIAISNNVTTDGDQTYTPTTRIDLGSTLVSTGTGTITNGITLGGPVTLTNDSLIQTQGTSDSDDIEITGTVDGGFDLTLTLAGEGDLTLGGTVGSTTALDFLQITNANVVNTGAITAAALHQGASSGTSASTTFGGALAIGASGASVNGVQLIGNDFTFNSTLTTSDDATTAITNSGALEINNTFTLDGAFTQTDNGGSVALDADISTTNDNISFGTTVAQGSAVELGAGTGTISLAGWNTSSNDLTLTADEIDFSAVINGGGALTLRPSAVTTSISVAGSTGTLDLSATDLGFIDSSFSLVTIGYTGAGEHAFDIGNASLRSSTTFDASAGGSISVSGAISVPGSTEPAFSLLGATTFLSGASINSNGGAVLIDGSLTLDGATATITTDGTSSDGNATITGLVTGTAGGAAESLTFDLGTGTLDVQGALSGAAGVADASGLTDVTITDSGEVDLASVAITGALSNTSALTGRFDVAGATTAGSIDISTESGNLIGFTGAVNTTGTTVVDAGGGDAVASFGSDVTATGGLNVTGSNISIAGPVEAGAMVFTANGTLGLNSTVTGTAGLSYDNDGLATFASTVSLAGNFTQTGGTGSTQVGGNITTGNGNLAVLNPLLTTAGIEISTGTGQQNYGGTVTLGGATTFTATGDGAGTDGVTFGGAVDGSGAIVFRSAADSDAYQIGDSLDTTTNVLLDNASLGFLDDGFASITFGYATGNAALEIGAVTLTDVATFQSGTGTVTITDALSITDGADAVQANLAFANAVAITNGGSVTTGGGTITFDGVVQITSSGGANSVTIDSGGGSIAFNSTVFGQDGGDNENLTVDSGTGAITISGALSGIAGNTAGTNGLTDVTLTGGVVSLDAVTIGGAFTLNNSDMATLAGDINAGSFDQSGGTGEVDLAGDITTNDGIISFGGDVTLTAGPERTLTSGTGDITLQSVDLGGFDLSFVSSGMVTVNGTISGGNNISTLAFTPTNVSDAIDVGDVTTPQAGAFTITGATINAIDNSVALIEIGTAGTGEHLIQVESFNTADGNAFNTDVSFLAPAGAGEVRLVDDFTNAGIAALFDAGFTLDAANAEVLVESATFNSSVADNGNDLTISAQIIDFEGGGDSVTGSGTLTLRGDEATDGVEIGADNPLVTGVLLDGDDINALAPGFAGVEFGYATTGAGEIAITNVNSTAGVFLDNDATFHAPLVVLGNLISGDLENGTNSLTFNGNFGTAIGLPQTISAAAVTFNGGLLVNNISLTIMSDSIDFLGGAGSVTGFSGLGTPELILMGSTLATAIDVGDNIAASGGGLLLDATDVAAFNSSVQTVQIGAATGSNAAIQIADATSAASINFNASGGTGSIGVEGDLTGSGTAAFAFNSGTELTTLLSGGSLTTDEGNLTFNSPTRVGEGASFLVTSTSGSVALNGVLDGTAGGAAEDIAFDLGSGDFTASADIFGDAGVMMADATGLNAVSFASGNDVTLQNIDIAGTVSAGSTARLTGTFATSAVTHRAGDWSLTGTRFEVGRVDALVGSFSVDNAGLLLVNNAITAVGGFSQTDTSGASNGTVELGSSISTTDADISFGSDTTVTASGVTLTAGTAAFASAAGFDTQGFDLLITANDYQLTGGSQSFTGTSSVTFRGATEATNMDIGGVTAPQGGFTFGEGDLAALDSGFTQIIFGDNGGTSAPTVQVGRAFNASAHRNPTVVNAQNGTITAERRIEGETGASMQLIAAGGTTFTNGLDISFNGGFLQVSDALTLATNATVTTGGGDQSYGGAIDGGFSFNANALNSDGTTGTLLFTDAIGGTTALTQLDLVGLDIQLNGIGTIGSAGVTGTTMVTATDDVLFSNVTYHTNEAMYAASADPDAAGPQMPSGDGNLRLLSFPVDFITSGDALAFNGQILLFNGAPMTATTAGGDISFAAIDNAAGAAGPASVIVDAGTGGVTLNGNIGATNAIGLLDITAGGVTLGNDVSVATLGTSSDDVFIRTSIDGNFALDIDAGPTGTIDISGFIGQSAALTNLTLNGFDVAISGIGTAMAQGATGTVAVTATDDILFGRAIYNAGEQIYIAVDEARMIGTTTSFFSNGQDISISGAVVRLEPGIDLSVESAGGNVTIGGPVEGDTGAEMLTLNAGTGTLSLAGAGGDDDTTPTSGIPSLDSIQLIADDLDLTGNLFGNILIIEPETATRRINLGGSPTANALNLSTSELGFIQSGFSMVTFGRGNGEHAIFVNDATFRSDTVLSAPIGAGRVTINGPLTLAEGSTFTINAANTTQLGGDINGSGGAIDFGGGLILIADSDVASAGGDITVDGTIDTDTLGLWALTLDASDVGGAGRVVVNDTIGGVGQLGSLTILADSAAITSIGSLDDAGVAGATTVNVDQIFNVAGDVLHSGSFDVTTGGTSLDAATAIAIVTDGGDASFEGIINVTSGSDVTITTDADVARMNTLPTDNTRTGIITLDDGLNTTGSIGLFAGLNSGNASGVVVNADIGETDVPTTIDVVGNTISIFGVTTQGNQSYVGSTTLNGSLLATGPGSISIDGTATIAQSVAITTQGAAADDITVTGSIDSGDAANPSSLAIDAGADGDVQLATIGRGAAISTLSIVGDTINISGNVRTSAVEGISITGNVLDAAGSFTATGDGVIAFTLAESATTQDGGSIEGAQVLLNGGDYSIGGNVFARTGDLTFSGNDLTIAGTTQADAGAINITADDATFTGNVEATAGAITITGSDGFANNILFGGDATAAAGGINITAESVLHDGAIVTTGGGSYIATIDENTEAGENNRVRFSGPVTIGGSFIQNGFVGADVRIGFDTLDVGANDVLILGQTVINQDLTITGTTIEISNTIDSGVNGMGDVLNRSLTINADDDVTLGVIGRRLDASGVERALTSVTVNGQTPTSISLASDVNTIAGQTYNADVVFGNDAVLDAGGQVTFAESVDASSGALTVTSTGGGVSFGGELTSDAQLTISAQMGRADFADIVRLNGANIEASEGIRFSSDILDSAAPDTNAEIRLSLLGELPDRPTGAAVNLPDQLADLLPKIELFGNIGTAAAPVGILRLQPQTLGASGEAPLGATIVLGDPAAVGGVGSTLPDINIHASSFIVDGATSMTALGNLTIDTLTGTPTDVRHAIVLGDTNVLGTLTMRADSIFLVPRSRSDALVVDNVEGFNVAFLLDNGSPGAAITVGSLSGNGMTDDTLVPSFFATAEVESGDTGVLETLGTDLGLTGDNALNLLDADNTGLRDGGLAFLSLPGGTGSIGTDGDFVAQSILTAIRNSDNPDSGLSDGFGRNEFFLDLGGDRFFTADLTGDGQTAEGLATALAGAVAAASDIEDLPEDTTISATAREELQELGLQIREAAVDTLLESIVGFALYNDTFVPEAAERSGLSAQTTANRLDFALVSNVIAGYRDLLQEQRRDPETGAIVLDPETNQPIFDDRRLEIQASLAQAVDDYYDATGVFEFDPQGFNDFIESDAAYDEQVATLERLRELLRDVELLGLSPYEFNLVKQTILGFIRPEALSRQDLTAVVDREQTSPTGTPETDLIEDNLLLDGMESGE